MESVNMEIKEEAGEDEETIMVSISHPIDYPINQYDYHTLPECKLESQQAQDDHPNHDLGDFQVKLELEDDNSITTVASRLSEPKAAHQNANHSPETDAIKSEPETGSEDESNDEKPEVSKPSGGKRKVSRISCPNCSKGFTKKSNLTRHLSLYCHQSVNHSSQRSTGTFACSFCPKRFTNKRNVKRHEKAHHTSEKTLQKTHVCTFPGCEKAYLYKHSLKYHQRVHQGEVRAKSPDQQMDIRVVATSEGDGYQCTVCSKVFSKRYRVVNHQVTHLPPEERPFACDRCPARFCTAGQQRDHIKQHSGVKSFKCTECGKDFFRVGELNRHVKIHQEPPKPHKCGFWGCRQGDCS